jgi:signal peptidase
MFDKLFTVGYYIMIVLVLTLGALLIGVQAQLIKGYELRIVQSGSMEPAISTGALVITKQQERYTVGDVITYTQSGPRSLPTTHRIIADGISNGELEYTTQGDANADPDPNPVAQSEVSGRVELSIPWLGYIIDFARQPIGFALMIVVPASVIIFDEVWTIVNEIRQRRRKKYKTKKT